MNYNVRIDDNFLCGDHVDGEVLQHTDLNELENVAKTAINANYEDIQKLQDGTISIGNSEKLDGASLSKFADETLQNSDTKVPTSSQVKQYVDGAISGIDLDGYYTKREIDTTLEDYYTETQTDDLLSTKVNYTDYANNNRAGVIKLLEDYGAVLTQGGRLHTVVKDYVGYTASDSQMFIGKGTLENVISGKGLIDNTVDDLVNYYKKSESVKALTDSTINFNTIDNGLYYIVGTTNIIVGDRTVASNFADNLVYVTQWSNVNRRIVYFLNLTAMYAIVRSGSAESYTYVLEANYSFVTTEELTSELDAYYTKAETDALIPDLTDYVKNTDYAGYSNAGVIKSWTQKYATDIEVLGYLKAASFSYSQYTNGSNNMFISKGTLENVITGKDLTTKSYVDGLVGDINSVLDAINGEVI